MGILADMSAVCLYASPLEKKMLQVLKYRYKSAAFISVHMIIADITNSFLWLTFEEIHSPLEKIKHSVIIPRIAAY
ncbi:hypothetical protein P3T76_007157 [Phytophthora citrophthora]|uniref:Uncharacterized protein n=1 Tax=Phytophthora citrophthora TaxID=4793 RepID=A0AAD9GMQ7_9STRA|nr:hypothetical protein P3T76_007157 [Phytophthora citrophthora]